MQYYYPQQQNQDPRYQQQVRYNYNYNYAPPAPPELTPEEKYCKKLRRLINGIGGLLLIFFGIEIILPVSIELGMMSRGLTSIFSDNTFLLLFNGVVSLLIFFFAGLIYCLIHRMSFAKLFPFSKIGSSTLWKLVIIGLAVSLMSNYVVDLLNNTFGLFGIENSGGDFDVGSEPNVFVYILTVAVLPALGEEFAFRGVIMGALRPYSEGLAILISSAAFALMHGNFVQLPFTFCCGLAFAYIDVKTNSLLPSILIHFFNNAFSVTVDVLISYKIVDNTGGNLIYAGIILTLCVFAFIFLKGFAKKKPGLFKLSGGNDVIPFEEKLTTAVTSPTMICYTISMLIFCVYTMAYA